jgi:putative ATPase
VIAAIGAAQDDVRRGLTGQVPPHLRDGHYAGAQKLGHATAYRYPHDHPGRVVSQQYAPDPVVGKDYSQPGDLGNERGLQERVAKLRAYLRQNEEST